MVLLLQLVSAVSVGCGEPRAEECVVVLEPRGPFQISARSLQRALDVVEPGAVLALCAEPLSESIIVRQSVEIQGTSGARLQGLPGAPTLRIDSGPDSRVVLRNFELSAPEASDQPALSIGARVEVSAEGLQIDSDAEHAPFAPGFSGLVDLESGQLELRRSTVLHRAPAGSAVAARSGASIIVADATIRSAGESALLLEASDAALSDLNILDSAGGGLQIKGGGAALSRVNVAGARTAALSISAANVTVEDSIISEAGGRGIDAVGSRVELTRVGVDGAGDDGVHVEGSTLLATDLSVSNVVGDGLEVIGGSLNVERAAISGCGGRGLVTTSCEGSVRDSSVTAVKASGAVSALANVEFSALSLRGSAQNGLEVLGGEVTVQGLSSQTHGRNGLLLGSDAFLNCAGCVLSGGIEGARVSGGSLLQMTGGQITGPVSHGISLRDESFAMVTDSQIAGAGTGIFVQEEYAQFTATRVAVTDSASFGVLLTAGTLSFLHSSASGSGVDGLRATGGTLTVSDSSFQNNSLSGIHLLGSTEAQLKASVSDNADWGLFCDGGAAGSTESSVELQICDLLVARNGAGSVGLINGCQQDQFCTEKQL
jgi:hypothetical protein